MDILFSITGIVTPASQRGRTLGFPTANLNISAEGLPTGIYLAWVHHGDRVLPALLFIGAALTFGDNAVKVEVYMLDEMGNWYGQEIRVEALKKLRDNKKFSSAAELIAQMKQDEAAARVFFESLSKKSYA